MTRKDVHITPGDGDPRHGTSNGYNNLDCRCVECQSAWAAYTATVLRKNRHAKSVDPNDPRHGTENFYTNYACRCPACRAIHAAYARNYNARTGSAS